MQSGRKLCDEKLCLMVVEEEGERMRTGASGFRMFNFNFPCLHRHIHTVMSTQSCLFTIFPSLVRINQFGCLISNRKPLRISVPVSFSIPISIVTWNFKQINHGWSDFEMKNFIKIVIRHRYYQLQNRIVWNLIQ